jgi:hypothetical protein
VDIFCARGLSKREIESNCSEATRQVVLVEDHCGLGISTMSQVLCAPRLSHGKLQRSSSIPSAGETWSTLVGGFAHRYQA